MQKEEVHKWTEIYYQRDSGWIGNGFPLRAVYELKTASVKGNQRALKALEDIFSSESDIEKKAKIASELKDITGKDYMTKEEIEKGLAASNAKVKWPLPPPPDYMP